MSRRKTFQQGFTLLELMIAMVLLSVVILGVFESLTRQHKASIVTEDIVEVQNNTRAIAALLEREIRMAGFMVPNATAVCGIDNTAAPDELYISETEPIVPDDSRAGDLGARITSGITATNVSNGDTPTLVLDASTTDLDGDGSYFYDNDSNGTPEVDFRVGGGFIIGDLANPHRGSICGRVIDASVSDIDIEVLAGELIPRVPTSDAAEELVIVPAARYRVNTTFQLLRNADLLANGVEDFQVSYFFDSDDDGVVDPAVAGPPAVLEDLAGTTAANAYDPELRDNSTLKEVRFSIVVRSRAGDPEFTSGAFINYENRAAIAGTDNFRRRAIVGRVRPRNIGVTGSI
jgi:prepilin-type N-terminal cleavage/methylation domain-containing protein